MPTITEQPPLTYAAAPPVVQELYDRTMEAVMQLNPAITEQPAPYYNYPVYDSARRPAEPAGEYLTDRIPVVEGQRRQAAYAGRAVVPAHASIPAETMVQENVVPHQQREFRRPANPNSQQRELRVPGHATPAIQYPMEEQETRTDIAYKIWMDALEDRAADRLDETSLGRKPLRVRTTGTAPVWKEKYDASVVDTDQLNSLSGRPSRRTPIARHRVEAGLLARTLRRTMVVLGCSALTTVGMEAYSIYRQTTGR